jgi:type I restriction enzyme R subunit
MLTTGYDVKRLKKMYLLRGPHAQSLLQTISRVNRPYKSPNGRVYKYGYIVDFIDIEEEYNTTIENYIKELEAEINENGEDEASLAGLVIDKEDIKLDAAFLCLDFIRHAKGEGHAGQECFATGAGSRRRSVPLT